MWYARAYNEPGVANLVLPYGGYLQIFPRFAGLASQLVDFAAAPLLMAVLALLVQMIAPVFLLSERFAWAVPATLAARRPRAPAGGGAQPERGARQRHQRARAPGAAGVPGAPRRAAGVARVAWLRRRRPRCCRASADRSVCCCCPWRHCAGGTGATRWSVRPAARASWLPCRSRAHAGAARDAAELDHLARLRPARAAQPARGDRSATCSSIFGGQIVVGGLTGVWTLRAAARRVCSPRTRGCRPCSAPPGIAFLVRAAWLTTSFALRLLLLFATLHMAAGLASPIIIGTAAALGDAAAPRRRAALLLLDDARVPRDARLDGRGRPAARDARARRRAAGGARRRRDSGRLLHSSASRSRLPGAGATPSPEGLPGKIVTLPHPARAVRHDADPRLRAAARPVQARSTIASASISTSMSGSIRRLHLDHRRGRADVARRTRRARGRPPASGRCR